MNKSIKTEIIINASREKVWQELTKFDQYPDWNPFIRSLTGEFRIGKRIRIELQNGDTRMVFTPRVLTVEPNKRFSWLGSLFIKGLFDGHHYFEIEEINPQQVLFRQGEDFSGILSGMILKKVGDNTRKGFVQMNEAMKRLVEERIVSS